MKEHLAVHIVIASIFFNNFKFQVLAKKVSNFLHAHTPASQNWEKSTSVVILKLIKPPEYLKSSAYISFLCILFKILERLIYPSVKPIVDVYFFRKLRFNTRNQLLIKLIS